MTYRELDTRALRRELLADRRACQEAPVLFFAPDGEESEAARELRERAAAALCADCPVRAACLEYALRIPPEHGVWGGFTAEEIAVVASGVAEAA